MAPEKWRHPRPYRRAQFQPVNADHWSVRRGAHRQPFEVERLPAVGALNRDVCRKPTDVFKPIHGDARVKVHVRTNHRWTSGTAGGWLEAKERPFVWGQFLEHSLNCFSSLLLIRHWTVTLTRHADTTRVIVEVAAEIASAELIVSFIVSNALLAEILSTFDVRSA